MTPKASIAQYEFRQDATAKLLLLTTRRVFSDDQIRAIRQLATEVKDWDFFVETAAKKFSITFAYNALKMHASEIVPTEAVEALEKSSRRSTLAAMRVAAAFINFHKKCIEHSGIKYAYLKGIALSCQFDRPYLDRFSRDVDVLVDSDDIQVLVDTALSKGYQLLSDSNSKEIATKRSDIEFIARHSPVVLLKSPEFVLIEVHRKMGKMSVSFDTKSAIDEAVEVSFSGITIRALEPTLHFVYVCYHHSRHFWSHLHWLSDLHTMLVHEDVERQRALTLASSLGIKPSIEAAYDFNELIGAPDSWGKIDYTATRGAQFLRVCLINLEGGRELEYQLRESKTLGEFISAWQISPGRYFSFWRNSWATRIRPSVAQHMKYQFPRYFHWMYWAENILILMKNSIAHLPLQIARVFHARTSMRASEEKRIEGDDAHE
ncbi:MAG: nucleotidyltransferase family protein [Pseudomonadota bacterium]